ncbi:MAG: polysulfide reductase NrfD [Sulfurospirillum sp.]|nr:polysulfide reductase NrfD [Sulfurospirillum sp.]MBL0703542.1 polysulfide reductase NrfD [Sulfurospirillum sp.]
MENLITTLSSITPDRSWGIDVVSYFWFNGASIATFLIFTLFYVFEIKRFKPIAGFALLFSFALFIPAMFNLLDDLKQPGRMVNFFLYGWGDVITSPMKWGSFLLILYPAIIVSAIYLLFKPYIIKNSNTLKRDRRLIYYISIVGIPIAILTHGYTGYEPAIVHGNLLWHTPLLPLLFLIAAMVSGFGILIFLVPLFQRFFSDSKKIDKESLALASKILSWILILNFIMHVLWLSFATVFNDGDKYILIQFFKYYISSSTYIIYSLCFIIPTIIGFSRLRYNTFFLLMSGVLTVVGIWLFRWGIVIYGQSIPRAMPGFLKYTISYHESISFASNIAIFIAALTFLMAIFPWEKELNSKYKGVGHE